MLPHFFLNRQGFPGLFFPFCVRVCLVCSCGYVWVCMFGCQIISFSISFSLFFFIRRNIFHLTFVHCSTFIVIFKYFHPRLNCSTYFYLEQEIKHGKKYKWTGLSNEGSSSKLFTGSY